MRPNAKQSRITISAQPAVIDSPVVSTDHEDRPRTLTLVGAGSPSGPRRIRTHLQYHRLQKQPTHFPLEISEEPPQESAEKDGKDKVPYAPKPLLLEGVADPTPYAFRPNGLANLIANNAKDLDALQQMGSAGELVWKRTVNGAVCRSLQFRISVNIAAAVIVFVTAVASSTESSVLTSVQLLWMNITIIIDTFAALALATDPASRDVLDRVPDPDRKTAPSFDTAMRMQIIGQSMYQTFIILLFRFAGDVIFGYDKSTHTGLQIQQRHSELNTLVFNAFVFRKIFNSINPRRTGSKQSVFAGIHKNFYFIIILIEVAAQMVIAFVGGAPFSFHHLSGKSWGVSLTLGFGSLPFGFLVRLIPEEPVERIFRKLALMQDTDILQVESSENQDKGRSLSAI
ncbi:hypothetical protein FRC04_010055 [Tulasnella sp. 424]|nr:hypothetical protein FRC04_010055 [Tulasnella sp. 424]KAG8957623.1 hypothetical protein FRC05_009706 [Tulasnella sp. 425]